MQNKHAVVARFHFFTMMLVLCWLPIAFALPPIPRYSKAEFNRSLIAEEAKNLAPAVGLGLLGGAAIAGVATLAYQHSKKSSPNEEESSTVEDDRNTFRGIDSPHSVPSADLPLNDASLTNSTGYESPRNELKRNNVLRTARQHGIIGSTDEVIKY